MIVRSSSTTATISAGDRARLKKMTKKEKDVAFLLQGFAEADIQDFVPSIKEEDKNDEL